MEEQIFDGEDRFQRWKQWDAAMAEIKSITCTPFSNSPMAIIYWAEGRLG
jgi:hypothetical protein